jgi:hypothetical protein
LVFGNQQAVAGLPLGQSQNARVFQVIALGIETVAIFTMVFTLIAVLQIKV